MLYKTVVLELLEEMHPALHRHLRLSRTLMSESDRFARELRASHLKWIELGTDAGAARELAVEELNDRLAREAARLEP